MGEAGLLVGPVAEDWVGDARYFEYSRAANPVGSGRVPPVPMTQFPPSCHDQAPTSIIPLDVRADLDVDEAVGAGPVTSPALCASFIRIRTGDQIFTHPTATSELYYVWSGAGSTSVDGRQLDWEAGDVFVLPAESQSTHRAETDATLYWVTDEPLLRYLGVAPTTRRFQPTLFPAAQTAIELDRVASAPHAEDRNRLAVLLNTKPNGQTQTVTHVLWAMVGLLPVGAVQRPHRHQSVALDLITACEPGCFTLIGRSLDTRGEIVQPTRVDWEPGGAFITPPGLWHAHHNESGATAMLLPVQDAGLQTYLRSLDIRFAAPSQG
jgi:gentisate 1,2-dioxygenase